MTLAAQSNVQPGSLPTLGRFEAFLRAITLAAVVAGDPDMKQSTDQLKVAIDVAQENLDKQKVFLKIYFNTDPQSRPLLFKKYNKSGLPVLK